MGIESFEPVAAFSSRSSMQSQASVVDLALRGVVRCKSGSWSIIGSSIGA